MAIVVKIRVRVQNSCKVIVWFLMRSGFRIRARPMVKSKVRV